ncbi:MAG: hypothetical protein ABSF25_04470 [Bryobacteraceae bacterium]|jgi:hypothetical protein
MFEHVTKTDAERAQSAKLLACGGFAALGIPFGTFLLLSGSTALGLANLLLGISAGITFLRGRKTHR